MPPKKKVKDKCGYCPDSTTGKEGLKCTMCDMWHHRECIDGMSQEFFSYLDKEMKEGKMSWMCDKCTGITKKIMHNVTLLTGRVEKVEERLTAAEEKMDKNEDDVKAMKGRLEEVEKRDDKEAAVDAVFKEQKDRESRENNLVIHGISEPNSDVNDGKKRAEIDICRVQELADKLEAVVRVKDVVKFSKRIGAKKDNTDRPLLLGFRNKHDRNIILDRAPKLSEMAEPWKKINVVTDLTKRQRKEDNDAREEAEKKNKDMSEEEAKNWQWKVVGSRGQRTAVKARVEEDKEGNGGGRRGGRLRSGRN